MPPLDWTNELIFGELAADGQRSTPSTSRANTTETRVDTLPDHRALRAHRRRSSPTPGSRILRWRPRHEAVLEPHHERVTWDAVIHSVADIEALRWPPRTVNVKPSRFGSVGRLFAAYDYCAAHDIGAYGGGRLKLGVGRDQIQLLAAIFHPDTPNDVAPGGFNLRPSGGPPVKAADGRAAGNGVRDLRPVTGDAARDHPSRRSPPARIRRLEDAAGTPVVWCDAAG